MTNREMLLNLSNSEIARLFADCGCCAFNNDTDTCGYCYLGVLAWLERDVSND